MATDQRDYCRISYWKRDEGYSYATGANEAWTHCEVAPVSSYSSYGTQTFTRDQIYQRDALLHLLAQAFERGRKDKAMEVRRVLDL
jgi:hypothetical protein